MGVPSFLFQEEQDFLLGEVGDDRLDRLLGGCCVVSEALHWHFYGSKPKQARGGYTDGCLSGTSLGLSVAGWPELTG